MGGGGDVVQSDRSVGEKMMRKWFDGASGVESPIGGETRVSPTLHLLREQMK